MAERCLQEMQPESHLFLICRDICEAAALCTVAGERLDTWPRITEAAAAGSRDTFPLSYINTSCSVGENCAGV